MSTSKAAAKAKPESAKLRRTESKEVRRRQLIDATIKSIAKYGLSGTTMTTVTSFAELSIGIVNFHFKTKDNLLAETLIFLAEEHREQWRKSYRDAALPPQAKLLALVDAHFHPRICNRQNLAVWFAFFGETAYRASYRDKITEIDSERIVQAQRLCREIIKDGSYERVNPETVTKTLEGLYDGLWLNILMYPAEFNRDAAKSQIRAYLSTVFPKHFSVQDT